MAGGIRDAKIGMEYHVTGTAAEDLRKIHAQLVGIQKLASEGINVRASGGGGSGDGGGGPITGTPTHSYSGGRSGGGNPYGQSAADKIYNSLRAQERREGAADARYGKADMRSAYKESEYAERESANQTRQRDMVENSLRRQRRQEEERQGRDRAQGVSRSDRVTNSLRAQQRREVAKQAAPGEAMTRAYDRQRIKREMAKADDFLGTGRKTSGRGIGGNRGAAGSGRGPRGGGRSGIATRALLNPGGAAGIQGFMGMGPAGMAVGIPLIANYIARYTMEATTRMSNIGQRGDMSSAQRREGVSENTPIIGGLMRAFRELTESVNGTTERIRVIGIRAELQASAVQSSARFDPQLIAAQVQQTAAANQAAAAQTAQVIPVGRFDRSTVTGEQLFQEEQRRLPHQIAIAAGQRQLAAAQANSDASRVRMGSLEIERQYLAGLQGWDTGERNRINRVENAPVVRPIDPRDPLARRGNRSADPRDPLAPRERPLPVQHEDRARNVRSRQNVADSQANLGARQTTENATLLQLDNTRAQVASQDRQNQIGLMRENLSIMQNRETAMVGSARNIGMMNPIQRMVGMQAFREVQRLGWEQSPQFLREQMMTVAPNMGNRMATQAGMGSAEQSELQRAGEFGGETRGIEGLRTAMVSLQESIQASVNEDAIRLSNDLLANTVVNNAATIANTVELKRVADELVRIRQQGRTDNPIPAPAP